MPVHGTYDLLSVDIGTTLTTNIQGKQKLTTSVVSSFRLCARAYHAPVFASIVPGSFPMMVRNIDGFYNLYCGALRFCSYLKHTENAEM